MAKTNPYDILKQRYAKNQTVTTTDLTSTDKVKFALNARMAICTRPGYVLCSCDYTNQEVYIASMESDDEIMQQPFSVNTPAKIKGDDGKEYKNPAKDLHLITATACEPKYFQTQPKWKWDSIARDPNTNPYIKGNLRDLGKAINFGCTYLCSPKTLSELLYQDLKKCEQWIKSFRSTYQKFATWADGIAKLGEVRGWIRNSDGRIKYCNESNSKGSENSAGRLAVNTRIQGLNISPLY